MERLPGRAGAALLWALLLVGAAGTAAGRAEPRAAAAPAQRLAPPEPGAEESLETAHFAIVFRPARLSRAEAEAAGRLAEQAWARCEKQFLSAPEGRMRLDLTPNFTGATGFARPANPRARDPRDRTWLIGVRYPDLEYLGLSAEYVLRHEIAHAFSGALAGSALGEGIADWSAGVFSGIPMRPWWGRTLREGGLWLDPDALFVTGDFPPGAEVDALIRTAQYVQSGLLVRSLVEKHGWPRFRAFAEQYDRLRGPLDSNQERLSRQAPPRGRGEERDPRQPPDAAKVRALFASHFNTSWERLRAEWEREMEADRAPAGEAPRLVLAQQIYGAVRNYEMWLLAEREGPSAEARQAVREAFTQANRSLAAGDLPGAARALARARVLVERLRRPAAIARVPRVTGQGRDSTPGPPDRQTS